jgi:hypothetical protein
MVKKTCGLIPIVIKYLDPLMTLINNKFNGEYAMNDLTKCLYSAVLIMSIYMDHHSLTHIRKCDVDHVQKYYKEMQNTARSKNPNSDFDPSTLFLDECRRSILSKVSSRYLYYVMITNAHVKSNTSSASFPGHVCVIEKGVENDYYIYQSYINQYSLKDYYDNYGGFKVTKDTIKTIFDELYKLYSNGKWTTSTTLMWKQFTKTDGSEFEGHVFKGNSFFCYRKVQINTCASKLLDTINKGMQDKRLSGETKDSIRQLAIEIKQIL